MSVSMKDGVQIKATIISKSGPPWEQQLLAEHKQKLLVSVPKGAPISTLKEKLEDKFTSSKLAELNRVLEQDNSLKHSQLDNMPARITGRLRDKLKYQR